MFLHRVFSVKPDYMRMRSVPMPPVVLINPFEVPEGKDEAFLVEWEAAKAFMARQPGYISTRLHRSLVPNARFRFINVAEWATVEDFQAALNHPAFVKLREATPFAHFPAVYEVIRT
jgi:heme-degrading monooxygenase HmoA